MIHLALTATLCFLCAPTTPAAPSKGSKAIAPPGMVLIEGPFGDKADRSLNRLTRQLTLIYPDSGTRPETVANVRAAGFIRVRRVRIEDTAWVIVGHK